jgi:hypothetical protein
MLDIRLTEQELAARFQVTTRAVQKWRHDGDGPPFLSVGKNRILYRLEDVIAYEERRERGGEIPQRAKDAMHKAASVLDTVTRWKMRDETRATIESVRDQLLHQLGTPGKEAA